MLKRMLYFFFEKQIHYLAAQQYSTFLTETAQDRRHSHRESRYLQREHIRWRAEMVRIGF